MDSWIDAGHSNNFQTNSLKRPFIREVIFGVVYNKFPSHFALFWHKRQEWGYFHYFKQTQIQYARPAQTHYAEKYQARSMIHLQRLLGLYSTCTELDSACTEVDSASCVVTPKNIIQHHDNDPRRGNKSDTPKRWCDMLSSRWLGDNDRYHLEHLSRTHIAQSYECTMP